MKYRLFSLTLLVLGLFVLAACSDDSVMSAPQLEEQATAQTYRLVETTEPGRGTSYPIMIGSAGNSEAGYLMVSNDAHNLYLNYNMVDSWRILNSSIHVGRSMDEIPMDEAGKPFVDQFRYGFDLQRGLSSYTFRIPLDELRALPGQSIMIASYASVYQIDNNPEVIAREGMISSWWFTANYRINNFEIGGDVTARRDEIIRDTKSER